MPSRRTVLLATAASQLAGQVPTGMTPASALAAGVTWIGLFADASRARIPPDISVVHTVGYSRAGLGAARYVLRLVGSADLGKPLGQSMFRTVDGRVFVLGEEHPTPQMFGAIGDGTGNDAPAFAALLAHARAGSLNCSVPVGTYRLLEPLDVSAKHDGFPWHSMDLLGEQMDGVVLLFDYDGPHALRINDASGSYSGMAGARIGRFTVMVAPGRRIEQPVRVLNLLNGHCLDIRVRADWKRLDERVELFRVSAATQWSRFTNILVDPYNAPESGEPHRQRATGISIGHGYRDVPLQSSAVSNNSFHDCTVNRCAIGFLSEASDATTTYNCRMVACDTNWVDRASYGTVHINPWDEGATRWGFVLDSAVVTDPNGRAAHKTQYPQIIGGYVGSVYMAGVTGADLRCALNLLEVTPEAERCRAVLLGQNGAVVRGAENDCHIDRFDTGRHAHIVSSGRQPTIHQWQNGGEFWLDEGGGGGFSIYGPAHGRGGHAGFREEIAVDGSHRSYAWKEGAIGQEQRTLVRRTTSTAQFFATPVLPESDGILPLGQPGRRWRSIHLATGPVVTSDRAAKHDIRPLPDLWLDVWGELRWKQFLLHGDDDGRRHVGLVAQDIVDAFSRRGIAPEHLGLLERQQGESGTMSGWGVRYDQCHAIEAAWHRREIDRLSTRLSRLEAS